MLLLGFKAMIEYFIKILSSTSFWRKTVKFQDVFMG